MNVRMVVSLIVSLFTSRVILDVLGVDDFGIYNVVGGIVVLFVFLNTAMSGATSRFITYELGAGDRKSINDVFCAAMTIHMAIAVAVFLLAETVGLYILEFHIDIPSERMTAARIVYQFSVLSTLLTIVQIPYNACIIAYEKMDIYAYIEIIKVLLKLGIVYLLLVFSADKLSVYAVLTFVVSLMIYGMYWLYCRRRFDTCRFYIVRDRKLLLPMLGFSGWELYGNGAVAARQQGMSILINNFFGVAMNAAAGIALQASSAISLFAQNITVPFRPQVIKEYSRKNFKSMEEILSMEISVCLLFIPMMAVPLYIYMDPVVNLWLKNVPPHAVEFCRISVLINFAGVFTNIFNTCIHATGRIRRLSIVGGSCFLASVLANYLVFRMGAGVMYAYYIWMALMIVNLIVSMSITGSLIKEISVTRLAAAQIRPLVCVIISAVLTFSLSSLFEINIINFIIFTAVNAAFVCMTALLIWIIPVYRTGFSGIVRNLLRKD